MRQVGAPRPDSSRSPLEDDRFNSNYPQLNSISATKQRIPDSSYIRVIGGSKLPVCTPWSAVFNRGVLRTRPRKAAQCTPVRPAQCFVCGPHELRSDWQFLDLPFSVQSHQQTKNSGKTFHTVQALCCCEGSRNLCSGAFFGSRSGQPGNGTAGIMHSLSRLLVRSSFVQV